MATPQALPDNAPPQANARSLVADKAFLGPEFLTWLYFHLEESGWELALPDAFSKSTGAAPEGDLVQFALGRRTALRTLDESGARVALTGSNLDGGGEVLQAVKRGALFEVLSLQVALDGRVYELTLSGKDGGLSSVKLPDMFSDPDEDGPELLDDDKKKRAPKPKLPLDAILDLRMVALDEIEAVFDALFARFLTRRLAQAWQEEEVRSMRQAVTNGLKARLEDV